MWYCYIARSNSGFSGPLERRSLPVYRRFPRSCCSVVQCGAVWCSVVLCVAVSLVTAEHSLNLQISYVILFPPIHCRPTATQCKTLQHSATHCSTQQHTTTHCNTQQRTTTRCNTLQHTATHPRISFPRRERVRHELQRCCSVLLFIALQHAARHCSTLQCTVQYHLRISVGLAHVHCNAQHTETRCRTMQRTVADCNAL